MGGSEAGDPTARLIRLASEHGVTVDYRDWRGRQARVAPDTLRAVLAALGGPPNGSGDVGGERVAVRTEAEAIARPRTWGLAVQLYALRSRASWGFGDLRDLADLATWSGAALGAGFVLVNPLHATEPKAPISPSPYLPTSRRFSSPLYLRVEDVPEYDELAAPDLRRIEALAAPLRAANATANLIDRDAVWTAKRAALEIVYRAPLSPARSTEFDDYLARDLAALDSWATWCAFAEVHGADWRRWPARLRDPRSDAVACERGRLADAVRFHAWLQWLVDSQLAAAQAAAREAGMPIGVIHDLAVGAQPGGADAWIHQDLLAPGVSVGAPPDEFNQRGQDWTQPPWHPGRLAASDYRPFREMIGGAVRHGGGLRVDHVMGLFRLWWVPDGMSPERGAYVRYDHEAMVGELLAAAREADALVVGEDLGTVEPWVHDFLRDHGVLGTSMLWFEREDDGSPLPPKRWRAACLATVGTHDMPPIASYLTCEHVTLRAKLGLLTRPEETERRDAAAALAGWRAALAGHGLLPAEGDVTVAAMTVALYAYLALTPARLVGVSLADAVGERRAQNVPGTHDEYPNWRVPLTDGAGRPVLLEDLATSADLHAVVAAISQRVPG